jgi:hypothetical protein
LRRGSMTLGDCGFSLRGLLIFIRALPMAQPFGPMHQI